MKRLFCLTCGLILSLTMFVSCVKDQFPRTPSEYFSLEGIVPVFDNVQFSDNVAYLGGLDNNDEKWARARIGAKGVSEPSEAKIIIVGDSFVEQNLAVLDTAYDEGKIIIIVYPVLEQLKTICDKLGWNFILPAELPAENCAIAFTRNHSLLLPAPTRIITKGAPVSGKTTKVEGERVYENTSVFMAARGLMSFISQVNKLGQNQTKTSVSAETLDEKINTFTYDVSCSRYFESTPRGRNLRIFTDCKVSYSVYPCYVPEGVNGHGDYYCVESVASYYAPTMYEYSDNPEVPVGARPYAHYWEGEYSYWGNCQFRGPYNSDFQFTGKGVNASDLQFASSGRPIPGTDIDTRSYTEAKSMSWEVGISGGWSKEEGANFGAEVGISGSMSSEVNYSMSDIKVINNSDNNSVKYEFKYQNLPAVDDSFDDYESKMTSISKSTADFSMAWEWVNPSTTDYDGRIIAIQTDVKETFNIWSRDTDAGVWGNDMFCYSQDFSDQNTTLLNLARIPVGCLRIENKCQTNQILFNIKVNDSATGQTVYEGVNNVARDEHFEVLLPQRDCRYTVSLGLGKTSYDTVNYYSYDSEIQLPLMLSDSDKKILNVVEGGGDFTSRAAYLKVLNQSATNLVRNLKVYTAGNELVYSHRSSLGFGQSADIFLNSNTEYYVTMEFGSATDWKLYRTPQNFVLPLYSSESDMLTLIANDNAGGDFVLQ